MNAVIRTDASIQIGTGHVMRCLTLAHALKENGVKVSFISRKHEGNLIAEIKDQGFDVYTLACTLPDENNGLDESKDDYKSWLGVTQIRDADESLAFITKLRPDWVIVDHYAIDSVWHQKIRPSCQSILVIDDLANRPHDCDVLLDQNVAVGHERYSGLVPQRCNILIGPKYALLRKEFKQLRSSALNRRKNRKSVSRLLINMGGVDKDNFTGQVLNALIHKPFSYLNEIIVVMGPHAPHLSLVKQLAAKSPIKCFVLTNVKNMGELMCEVDLAIGASGATTWERCCLGLPSIQMVIAENQKAIAQDLASRHVVRLANDTEEVLSHLATASDWVEDYSNNACQVTDGKGIDRVVKALTLDKV